MRMQATPPDPRPNRRRGAKTDPNLPWPALRHLEAAVRHSTFKLAGAEVGCSHAAVSFAVKRLEAKVGVRLFERRRPTFLAHELAETYRRAASIVGPSVKLAVRQPPTVAAPIGIDPNPPWRALRLLETAVRNKTFVLAGAEVGFSPSAVSQAMKRLEAKLGEQLFEQRQPTALALQLAESYRRAASMVRHTIDVAVTSPPTVRRRVEPGFVVASCEMTGPNRAVSAWRMTVQVADTEAASSCSERPSRCS
jgi:DNA-binding transcriptional LysR family regulator